MPEQKVEKTEEELKEEKEKKEADMTAKLSKMEAKVEDSSVLAKILADPDVRMLLEAKQKGEKVKVVEDKPKKMNYAPPEDYEELSNKQLAEHILKQVGNTLDTSLASKLEPLINSIKNFEGYVGNIEAKTVSQQIDGAKKKFSDFNDYIPEMRELNKLNPSLNVEELYMIAKRRKVGPEAQNTESEKPTSSSTKIAEKQRKIPLPKGRAGFDQLLKESLDGLDLPDVE